MALSSGSRLGAYEIIAAIGAGGMGEVYRARDPRLGRDVAIKILPDHFADDPDRLARFQREAQTLASLNHPNIGSIYGVEDSGGVRALVLELVDGVTLADRIAQGPIPVAEAVVIARQICAALEAAHERGIIHRDLKPANIKLKPDGTVKVLDFGLAKALDANADASPLSPALSQSPTLTSPAMTRMGMILGTAVYMSPEQAKGKPADKRSDIWAFGCVLFEMLTAKRAFDGDDLTETIAAVVRGEPEWTALPRDTPPQVRVLLKGCLEKDRKVRIGDIAVARFLLDQGAVLAASAAGTSAVPSKAVSRTWRILPWALAGLIAAAAAVTIWMSGRPGAAAQPMRLVMDVGADTDILTAVGGSVAVSPDGRLLAFSGSKTFGETPQLYIRRLDQLQASALAGTDGAFTPFFSPDGKWIAFFAQGKLKKIAVTGGSPVTLCEAPTARGGSWGEDGMIVFTPNSAVGSSLHRVSSDGGTSEKLIEIAKDESSQRWAQVLPGAKAVIFTSGPTSGTYDTADIVAQPLPSGARKTVLRGAFHARYLRSGHLLYVHEGTLFAVPFDADALEVTGAPVPVVEGATTSVNGGGAQFAISDGGTLVYLAGTDMAGVAPIRWLDRAGKTALLRSTASDWSNPSFSPDGRKLAMDIFDGSQSDVWIYEWERDTLSRLTFDPADDVRPIWTSDGRYITFGSRRGDKSTMNLYWQPADGTGEVQRLTDTKNNQFPTSWHPKLPVLAFTEQTPNNGTDLMVLPMEGNDATGWKPGVARTFLSSPFSDSSGMFSPDGRWMAYISNESGRNDIYVRPFPGPGGKWQISTTAADDPTWSRTAPQLFFMSTGDLRLMVAPYRVTGDSFQTDKPVLWSETRLTGRPRAPSRDLDVHPDGLRFAVSTGDEQAPLKQHAVTVVMNFFEELRRVAPAKK
jgi:Tol biopolymer transport system component